MISVRLALQRGQTKAARDCSVPQPGHTILLLATEAMSDLRPVFAVAGYPAAYTRFVASSPTQPSDDGQTDPGLRLGRTAGRIMKAARPGLERLAARARPGIEKAGHDAMQYARDHEDELKHAALRLARARVAGPLGLVVEAVARAQNSPRPASPVSLACPHCDAPNPTSARFCNQCGLRISTA